MLRCLKYRNRLYHERLRRNDIFSFHSIPLTVAAFRNIQIVHTFRNRVDVIPILSFSRKGTPGMFMPNSIETILQNVQRVPHKLIGAAVRRQLAGTC